MQALIVPLSAPEATDAYRFGPKAANLAALGQAGLPIPGGFCLDARAYRIQLAALGLEHAARSIDSPEPGRARRAALEMKLGLLNRPITPEVLEPLLAARRNLLLAAGGEPIVVRSSALVEDRFGSSFAHAGRRFGPPACCATWPSTTRAPHKRRWRSSSSRSCRRVSPVAD